jgi:hypothetical protein
MNLLILTTITVIKTTVAAAESSLSMVDMSN